MKKLVILLALLPCFALAGIENTLLYVKIDTLNDARYEFWKRDGSTHLEIWKTLDVEVENNVRETTEILQEDISFNTALLYSIDEYWAANILKHATYDQIIWMVMNPGIDTALRWMLPPRSEFAGQPWWLPVHDFKIMTTGVQFKVRYHMASSGSFSGEADTFEILSGDKTSEFLRLRAFYFIFIAFSLLITFVSCWKHTRSKNLLILICMISYLLLSVMFYHLGINVIPFIVIALSLTLLSRVRKIV